MNAFKRKRLDQTVQSQILIYINQINRQCNKILKMSSFKSSDDIKEEEDEPYRDFGYYNAISDPIKLAK